MRKLNARGRSGWRRWGVVVGGVVSAWVAVVGAASPAHPDSGDLDPTFGGDGRVTTDFDGRTDNGFGLALQPDGKLVVVGVATVDDSGDFALARYTEDGELDETFGTGGKVTTDFGTTSDEAWAVVLQADGKIVVAGRTNNRDFALSRYNSDGELDETFGTAGKVTTDFDGGGDEPFGVAVQPDGKIVAVGRAEVESNNDFALARYTADGELDEAFGTGGKVTTDFAGSFDSAFEVVLQPDGKIVVGGSVNVGFGSDFGLARYTTDGELDDTFGTGGKLTTDLGSDSDEVRTVALQPDGKIVAAGSRGQFFALARYSGQGELDPTFGTDGKVATDIEGRHAVGALQPDGKIVAAGVARVDGNDDFALAQFTAAGELDETFGTGGAVTTDFDGGLDEAFGVVLQPDGKIVAAGLAIVDFIVADFALARYLGEPVTPEGLGVDGTPIDSDGNGVFEPGEQVVVAPEWKNNDPAPLGLMGTASGFTGPPGANYMEVSTIADYGTIASGAVASCLDTDVCYALEVGAPPARPAPHWDAAFDETLDTAAIKSWSLHIGDSFTDVPRSHLFYTGIETLLHSGVTGGCGDGSEYCPGATNTRSQMPTFMLRALEGPDYTPPACDEGDDRLFDDVPASNLFCPWIEDLAGRGIVSGCGDDNYCPSAAVTRAQMAIFLLKTLMGSDYTPSPCSEMFDDVPCPSLFADWVEDLAGRAITGGCTATEYCPTNPVTRGQMAVFVTGTFGFTLYGP